MLMLNTYTEANSGLCKTMWQIGLPIPAKASQAKVEWAGEWLLKFVETWGITTYASKDKLRDETLFEVQDKAKCFVCAVPSRRA